MKRPKYKRYKKYKEGVAFAVQHAIERRMLTQKALMKYRAQLQLERDLERNEYE